MDDLEIDKEYFYNEITKFGQGAAIIGKLFDKLSLMLACASLCICHFSVGYMVSICPSVCLFDFFLLVRKLDLPMWQYDL